MSERTIGTVPLEKLLADAAAELDSLKRAADAEGITAADLAKSKGWSLNYARDQVSKLVERGTWAHVGFRTVGHGKARVYRPVASPKGRR